MGFKREEIRDFSPLSLKKLNDNIRYLWLKSFKNISFGDFEQGLQNVINNKTDLPIFNQTVQDLNTTISNKAESTVVDSLTGRVSTAESSITQQAGQIVQKVSYNEVGTQITQNASSVKIAVGDLGGNNLIKNGGFEFGINGWSLNGSPDINPDQTWQNYNGKSVRIASGAYNNGIYQRFTTISGQKYTVQFMVMMDGYYNKDGTIGIEGIWSINPKNVLGWTKYKYTFTATATSHVFIAYGISGSAFFLDDVKVEPGENATAWSPNANELKTTDVSIDITGLSVTNGSVTVRNNSNIVTIDGSLNMFKIVSTGIITLYYSSGVYESSVSINHGLGYKPAFLVFREDAPNGTSGALPAFAMDNFSSEYMGIREVHDAYVTNSDLYIKYRRSESYRTTSGSQRYRYYILKEAAI